MSRRFHHGLVLALADLAVKIREERNLNRVCLSGGCFHNALLFELVLNALRGKQLDGVKFRRQQPIGQFVVDFYNSDYRLVVEVDGPIHEFQKEADSARQEILEVLGLEVLRLKAEMVGNNLPAALEMIRAVIQEIQESKAVPAPSPFMGEGQG